MADSRYQKWSTKKIQDEILRVRLIDLEQEQELCFTLNERAKLTSDRYALAFSYTFLADCYLAVRDNKSCILYLSRAKSLCEAQQYDDLLIRIYNFYGMFCNAIYDEITALDYYLKSLDIAEKNQNYMQMASAYNNIATCFDLKHNYEEAVVFYRKSYDVLAQEKENTAYSRAVSLTNLCNCSFKLHKLKELQAYITLFQRIDQQAFVEGMLLLYRYCVLMEYYMKKDEKFRALTKELFEIQQKVENRLLVHQVITNVCDMMLDINARDYAEECLKILADINQDDDIKSRKELQKLIVKYCEKFCDEAQQYKAYSEFHKIILAIEDMDVDDYSAGLSAKMELHRSKAVQVDLEKENEALEKTMNLDDLTHVWNRRCFNHDMESSQLFEADTLAIAMLDIDYFKEYNDLYGHQMGDQALVEVGRTLLSVKGDGIRPYRYGGDEFSIIFLNQEEKEVKHILDTVKRAVAEKHIEHAGSYTAAVLSLSCGYAFTADKEKDQRKLLKEADAALYRTKANRTKGSLDTGQGTL